MTHVGLSEAAQFTGRNQTTIHRAMKAGRLPCIINANGDRQYATEDLERVFGRATPGQAPAARRPVAEAGATVRELAALEGLLAEREATIRDLRQRLDASEAERRALVMGLLADRSAARSGWLPKLRWKNGNGAAADH